VPGTGVNNTPARHIDQCVGVYTLEGLMIFVFAHNPLTNDTFTSQVNNHEADMISECAHECFHHNNQVDLKEEFTDSFMDDDGDR